MNEAQKPTSRTTDHFVDGARSDPPIEELIAGNEFRQTVLSRADDKTNLLWHGWVIMDAFLAGIQWERNRAK